MLKPGLYDINGNLLFELTKEDVEKKNACLAYLYQDSDGIYKQGRRYDNPILGNNTSLIVLPPNLEKIGRYAFVGFRNVSMVIFPEGNSLKKIGKGAFNNCRQLTSINIPDSVEYIGDEAFSCCGSLKHIHLPENLTHLGRKAFWLCRSLLDVHFPKNVEEIRDVTFYECRALENIYFPENLKVLSSKAFTKCTNVYSISIPENVVDENGKVYETQKDFHGVARSFNLKIKTKDGETYEPKYNKEYENEDVLNY